MSPSYCKTGFVYGGIEWSSLLWMINKREILALRAKKCVLGGYVGIV